MSHEFDPHAFDEFQRQVITEFRANAGRVGGMFEGSTLALLTTVGARTGRPRTCPLAYLEIDGQPLVVASAMGGPTHPAWYHNIRRNPLVTVETGTQTYEAMAGIPAGHERDALFAAVVAADPGFSDYQARTTRTIPVVTLHPVHAGGLGDFLVEGHDWLRTELAALRIAADGPPDPDLLAQLREHCRTFCGELTRHHTGEDVGAFPMLAGRFPALASTLTALAEEHHEVARLQVQILAVAEAGDRAALADDLNRLTAHLEAHFAREETAVVTALNALTPAPAPG